MVLDYNYSFIISFSFTFGEWILQLSYLTILYKLFLFVFEPFLGHKEFRTYSNLCSGLVLMG